MSEWLGKAQHVDPPVPSAQAAAFLAMGVGIRERKKKGNSQLGVGDLENH